MQAELTIANANVGHINESSITEKIGEWMGRVFGCWHTEMSRPFSRQGQAYRVCLSCGAQRQFNLGNWKMQGGFQYHVPASPQFHAFPGMAAVRRVIN